MNNLLHPIDIYCERHGPEVFAEPINAVSNAAFFIAAYMLVAYFKASKMEGKPCWLLTILIVCIGIGSSLFHLFANYLTMLMDVIPITLFLLSFIWIFARYVMQLSWLWSAVLLIGFILLGRIASLVPEGFNLNGSIGYVPALIYLIGITLILSKKAHIEAVRYLKYAVLAFVVSITMRSIDMWLCEELIIGTHFLWHIFNGVVLYYAVKGLAIALQESRARHE